jgi:hypothetical protein
LTHHRLAKEPPAAGHQYLHLSFFSTGSNAPEYSFCPPGLPIKMSVGGFCCDNADRISDH